MGVPLLAALLGPAAAGPVLTTVLVDLLFTSSLCIALAQTHERVGAQPGRRHPARAARSAESTRCRGQSCWAWWPRPRRSQLPGPLDTVVRMLGDAATPVALFTIGTVLWRAGAHVHARTPVALFLPLALIKLLVHPLLVLRRSA